MFASGFVTLFFVALVAVNVVGYPVPLPIRVRYCHVFDEVREMLTATALSARLSQARSGAV